MDTVQFRDVEVIDEAGTDLLCRVGAQRVVIPALLLQRGTTIARPGDAGTLVIPRWLAIGVGLVWPLRAPAAPAAEPRKRRKPRRASQGDRAAEPIAGRGSA
jgi:hypothetical protein